MWTNVFEDHWNMNIKFTKPEASHLMAEGFKEPRPMATFGYPHFETNPKVISPPPAYGICMDL